MISKGWKESNVGNIGQAQADESNGSGPAQYRTRYTWLFSPLLFFLGFFSFLLIFFFSQLNWSMKRISYFESLLLSLCFFFLSFSPSNSFKSSQSSHFFLQKHASLRLRPPLHIESQKSPSLSRFHLFSSPNRKEASNSTSLNHFIDISPLDSSISAVISSESLPSSPSSSPPSEPLFPPSSVSSISSPSSFGLSMINNEILSNFNALKNRLINQARQRNSLKPQTSLNPKIKSLASDLFNEINSEIRNKISSGQQSFLSAREKSSKKL